MQVSDRIPAQTREHHRGLGKFRSKPMAVFLIFLTSILGFVSSAQAHNLDQQFSYVNLDRETLDMMRARALAGQPVIVPGDTLGVLLKSTPASASFTGVGGLVTIQFCNRDS